VAAFTIRNTDEWQAQKTELTEHKLSQSQGMENSSLVNNSVTQNLLLFPSKAATQDNTALLIIDVTMKMLLY